MFDINDLHMSKKLFAEYIKRYTEAENYYKEQAKRLYDRCDKNDPDSKATFDMMNRFRDISRNFKKKRLKFEKLQRKVKKEIAEHVEMERWMAEYGYTMDDPSKEV